MPKLSTEEREELPASEYACPIDKKLPINDAAHVRNAMARFDQVITDKYFENVKKFRDTSKEG
jgi:hypothetical protein